MRPDWVLVVLDTFAHNCPHNLLVPTEHWIIFDQVCNTIA